MQGNDSFGAGTYLTLDCGNVRVYSVKKFD